MNPFFRGLSSDQQVGALFILMFGPLRLASVATLLLSLRERSDTPEGEAAAKRLRSARRSRA